MQRLREERRRRQAPEERELIWRLDGLPEDMPSPLLSARPASPPLFQPPPPPLPPAAPLPFAAGLPHLIGDPWAPPVPWTQPPPHAADSHTANGVWTQPLPHAADSHTANGVWTQPQVSLLAPETNWGGILNGIGANSGPSRVP